MEDAEGEGGREEEMDRRTRLGQGQGEAADVPAESEQMRRGAQASPTPPAPPEADSRLLNCAPLRAGDSSDGCQARRPAEEDAACAAAPLPLQDR